MANSVIDVQKAYLAYFGRPADPVGLAYWMTQDAASMRAGFAASAEYATLYSGMTAEQRVEQVYQNLFGRASDAAGKAYWVAEFNAGRETVSSLVASMQNNAIGVDVATINNRVTYAIKFTDQLDTPAEVIAYNGTAAASAARGAVSAVTSTEASLSNATAQIATDAATVLTGVSPAEATAAAAADQAAAAAAAASAFTLIESGNAVTLTGSSTDPFVYAINGAATRAGAAVTASSGSLTNSVTSFDGSGYAGAETITLNANGDSVKVGSGADIININGKTATGTYTGLSSADTIKMAATADIKGVNAGAATGAGILDLSTVAVINATMTAAQHNGFTTINANAGNDTITLTTAGTISTDADIGTYSVVEGSVVTVGAAATHAAQVITETGAVGTVSTFTLGAGVYTGVWTGIDALDVIKVVNGTNVAANTGLDGGVKIDFQSATANITLNNTQNGTVTFLNAASGTQTITLSEAATSFTGDAAIEAYVLGGTTTNAFTFANVAQSVTAKAGAADTIRINNTTAVVATVTGMVHGEDVIQLGGTTAAAGILVGAAAANGTAHAIVFDSATNIGFAAGSSAAIGNSSGATAVNYAVASDTGIIYYDANGDWTEGNAVQIGTVGVVASLADTDFTTA